MLGGDSLPVPGSNWVKTSGLEDVAGRTDSQHRDRIYISRRGLETTERINDETALASEMAETISSWGSEATLHFAAKSKGHKMTETKPQRNFHAGKK